MLLNLHKKNWTEGLRLQDFEVHKSNNEKTVKVSVLIAQAAEKLSSLEYWTCTSANKSKRAAHVDVGIVLQQVCTRRIDINSRSVSRHLLLLLVKVVPNVWNDFCCCRLKTRHVGKQDPKRHLEEEVEAAMSDQISQALGTMMMALSAWNFSTVL